MRPLSLLTQTCASLRLTHCPISVSVHVLPTAAFSASCCTYVTVTPRPAPREPNILLYLCNSHPAPSPTRTRHPAVPMYQFTPRPAPREPDILLDMQTLCAASSRYTYLLRQTPYFCRRVWSPTAGAHCCEHCWCILLVHGCTLLVLWSPLPQGSSDLDCALTVFNGMLGQPSVLLNVV